MNHTSTRSILALLRGLAPRRTLSFTEQLRVAELQANRLLSHFDTLVGATPDEIITELPRIRVEREHGLPVSGAAHWNGHYWIISLNADDHHSRQRFSLAHELKHIIDHPGPPPTIEVNAYRLRERVADHFAACLLMPKRTVKRLWFQGPQDIIALAKTLRVSPAAMRYRLDQLGLTEPPGRCLGPRRAVYRTRQRAVVARTTRSALAGERV